MSTARPVEKVEDIPEKLYDASTKTTYKRLRFFGKVIYCVYLLLFVLIVLLQIDLKNFLLNCVIF